MVSMASLHGCDNPAHNRSVTAQGVQLRGAAAQSRRWHQKAKEWQRGTGKPENSEHANVISEEGLITIGIN